MKTLSGWSRFVGGVVFPCGGLAVICGLRFLQYLWRGGEGAVATRHGFLAASMAAMLAAVCINLVIVIFQFEDPKKLTLLTAIAPAALAAFLLIASW